MLLAIWPFEPQLQIQEHRRQQQSSYVGNKIYDNKQNMSNLPRNIPPPAARHYQKFVPLMYLPQSHTTASAMQVRLFLYI
jgi:hypothetical protein